MIYKFRPNCKAPLPKKEQDAFKSQIFIIKAWASDYTANIKNRPSREIAIRGNATLEKLVDSVLKSFDFENDHMHIISDNLKEPNDGKEVYAIEYDDEPLELVSTNKIVVAQVFDKIGKKMLIQFDMGDDWRFIVELQNIREPLGGEKRFPYSFNFIGEAPEQYPNF